MTIFELENNKCTGCQLCYNICPVGAIMMQENEEGYLHPIINDKCINCGLCAENCPQLRKAYGFVDGNICFAIQCDDQIRNRCSSGGVFKALADKILEEGGVVCGAAFDESQHYLRQVMIHDKKIWIKSCVQNMSKAMLD